MSTPGRGEAPAVLHGLEVKDDVVVGQVSLCKPSDRAYIFLIAGGLAAVDDNGSCFSGESEG